MAHDHNPPQPMMALPFPALYLMHIGFENNLEALQGLEREIGPSLFLNGGETNIFVGKVSKPKRAVMELKALKVFTEPVVDDRDIGEAAPPVKKQKLAPGEEKDFVWIDSDTASEDGMNGDLDVVKKSMRKTASSPARASSGSLAPEGQHSTGGKDIVKVLQLSWVTDSLKAGDVLPMEQYVVYTGVRISKSPATSRAPSTKLPPTSILTRARADSPPPASFAQTRRHSHGHSYSQREHKRPHLLSETTSEYEEAGSLPPLPDYCSKEYSCQRPTPFPTPNDPFIDQLKKILRTRELLSDKIGVRAYNMAISAIASYPYTITTIEEILRLPGCGPKYAALYQEWKNTGHIREVQEGFESEKTQALDLFYGILDVGPKIANSFYNRGWRDLDDIVSEGWDTLDRNQQVGLKWYDEINAKIPREEVQRIGDVVLGYANKIQPGFQMVICGGYRRGKKKCGDVDVILTHPDEKATYHLINDLVYDLAKDGWVSYTLQLSNKNSERNQVPLLWRGGMPRSTQEDTGLRVGFDSLDKALVVWQDPDWETKEEDLEKDPKAKNPNAHRRVDIIISPWKTAGCAIVGWSGGTMFERDIRRYCRKERGYKFDSSGVRRLEDGAWIDLEGDEPDLLAKEKKVFEGLGLEWIEPTFRCTDG